MSKSIYFSVTNDLTTDQRMRRICTSLQVNGYDVTIIGRDPTKPIPARIYKQIRLKSWFKKGKAMYIEYNIRLLFSLLTQKKPDAFVAIDLDTIIPVYMASRFRSVQRVYDAHEWFSEMKEVITRPAVKRIWKWVEKTFVPRFPNGYTVSYSIADSFKQLYVVSYPVFMNATDLKHSGQIEHNHKPYLLYQGAVNQGRCLEWLIPAMKKVDMPLWICGEGNFMQQTRSLIVQHNLSNKIRLLGNLPPEDLLNITREAYAGINLIEPLGNNQLMSLANKFFDYFHCGIPQLTMNFTEYRRINDQIKVAVLIDNTYPELISEYLNKLIENKVLYEELRSNCKHAAKLFNWEVEQRKLLDFYKKLFNEV
ncbi:MAG: glycosyltransferase family 4 protein [Sphingobacteriales bacterium]